MIFACFVLIRIIAKNVVHCKQEYMINETGECALLA